MEEINEFDLKDDADLGEETEKINRKIEKDEYGVVTNMEELKAADDLDAKMTNPDKEYLIHSLRTKKNIENYIFKLFSAPKQG